MLRSLEIVYVLIIVITNAKSVTGWAKGLLNEITAGYDN